MSDISWCGRKRSFLNVDDEDDTGTNKKINSNNTTTTTTTNNNNPSIYSIGTNVYFYTSITVATSILFQKEINKVYKSIVDTCDIAKTNGYDIVFPPIVIHLFSPGGVIFASFAMIDYLRQLKKKDPRVIIHTIIEGRAASAATLVSVTADKRLITEYGYMLIHQLTSASWGKYNELKDDMENCDVLMERIKSIYKNHTKIPLEEMDKILSHDLYWDANKCLAMGLVDEII